MPTWPTIYYKMSEVGIPTVKLSDFHNPELKQTFIKQLADAYQSIGFVAVEGHGISREQISALYKAVEAFYALPESVKKKYYDPNGGGQRGYTPFGLEHAKDSNAGDLKEFYHFGQFAEQELPYPENVLCEELPAFNESCLAMYRQLENLGRDLLKAIALFLALPEDYFETYVVNGNSILRPIHYPPITQAPKNAVRAGAHEDINLITLLIGASADGLQVLNQQGTWVDVKAKHEMIVVNVGDMLQRLTNGVLKSTTHRVVNPPKEKWSEPRFSIPFFLHPIPNMPLNCLEQCISETQPKQWEDIKAGDYLIQRLIEIGLIKP